MGERESQNLISLLELRKEGPGLLYLPARATHDPLSLPRRERARVRVDG